MKQRSQVSSPPRPPVWRNTPTQAPLWSPVFSNTEDKEPHEDMIPNLDLRSIRTLG